MIAGKITVPVKIIAKDKILEFLQTQETPLLITAGAGDIDQLKEPIAALLKK
jgi:UDP-N-acetylmuramate--alanine ligase